MALRDKPLVLIADDDIVVREILQETLIGAGYAVETAGDGDSAVAIFDRLNPDIVLLDVVMPGRDGFAVCDYIRRRPGGEHVPILMITARNSLATIHEAFRVGVTDIVPKPINWTALLHRLHFVLRTSQAAREAKLTEARHNALMRAAPDLILRLDYEGRVIDASTPLNTDQSGDPGDLIGRPISSLLPESIADTLQAHIRRAVETGNDQSFSYETEIQGVMRAYEIRLHTSPDNEVIAVMRDITERLIAQSELTRLTYSDNLTGLVKRSVGLVQLNQALEASKRKDLQTAVMCLNVDFFQRVNERHGHRVGDEVLAELARRIRDVLRRSDILARLMDGGESSGEDWMGGDEFLLVLPEVKNAQKDATGCSTRLHESLHTPFEIEGKKIQLTASIGIACFPEDADDADRLVEQAVQAMKLAKRRGRNQDCFYGSDSDVINIAPPSSEPPPGPRPICFRPLVACDDEHVVAHRVHPCADADQPADPAAQHIRTTTEFFGACAAIEQLTRNSPNAFRFMVELPNDLFEAPGLLAQVDNILGNLDRDRVEIDITIRESTAITNPERTRELFQAFMERKLGAGLCGYGGNSLHSLTDFPMTQVTLSDGLSHIRGDNEARLVEAVIHIAHHLSLEVVSGHVSDDATRERLKILRCDLIQGDFDGPDIRPSKPA